MNRRRALHSLAALGLTGIHRQETSSLLIRGGRVVTADGQRDADVRVRGGKIVEVAPALASSDETVMEAEGLLVLPGGIDPHAHLSPPWADDFESGSKAALAGGITTIGCMVSPKKGETTEAALEREETRALREGIADFLFHPVIGAPVEATRRMLARLSESGRTSLKIFMVSPRFDENEDAHVALIRLAGSLGMLTLLHCEDAGILAATAKRMAAEGRTSLAHFPESRPVEAEVRAVERAVAIGEKTKAPIYIVHLSSGAALDVCQKAQERGVPVFVETRPLYLQFTKERFAGPEGPLYVGQPPLRNPSDVEALWRGIADGAIDTLGSDHAPWTREQKLDPSLDITNLRPGVAALQTMLPLVFSEGVVRRKLPLERFVAVSSTNAARLFGLYPAKGTIDPGADADLVLWDPAESRELTRSDGFSKAGFDLLEGYRVTGWPSITIRRGEIVFREGRILAPRGSGRIPRRGATDSYRR
ncbi:MAG: dihydroorotase [Vicinamibacteria bacterium]